MIFIKHISYGLFSFLILFSLLFLSNLELCEADVPVIKASAVESKVELKPGAKAYFTVRVVVPQDHHVYLDRGDDDLYIPVEFEFTDIVNNGYDIETVEIPEGEREEKVKATVLRGENRYRFAIEATGVSPSSNNLQINLRYQICNDISNVCFMPNTISLPLPVMIKPNAEEAITPDTDNRKPSVNSSADVFRTTKGEGFTGWLLAKYHEYSRNIFISFFFMVLAGILAAATPCVYPMLPITSAFLMQRGGGSRERGRKHSLLYFLGIILVYMIMGYVAGMTGGALNIIMRSTVVNIVLAIFFAILALSMLGFYDLSFGQGFKAKIDTSVKSKAGYSGTFLMGMVAGLVISPCVGPVVFALLLQITNQVAELRSQLLETSQSLSFLQKSLISGRGGILMGGFGIGIGIPFFLVGIFSNKMPKAGSWMVYVKYALGLAILYFAFTYYMKGMGVSHVKTGVAFGILLGVVSIFASVYLGLFKNWSEEMMPAEKLKKALSLILLIFGIHFFYNGLAQSGLLLESSISGERIKLSMNEEFSEEIHGDLVWQRDLENAMAMAGKQNKPIFIDFYADWCANCVAFKKLSLRNNGLNKALKKAVLLKIYDTDKQFRIFQDDPLYAELKTGLPFFVILGPDGKFFWKGTQYNAVNTIKKMIEEARNGPK